MPSPRFSAQPVDESFFDTAPFKLRGEFDIPQPSARVWADLTSEHPLGWCKILKDVSWTSPAPFGVGTTRTVQTVGSLSVLEEYYFRWEEGRRHSFYVLKASAPMFRRLAEDYLVEPTSDTSCRFTWTIVADPHPLARIANPLNRMLLGTLFTDTRKYYGIS